MGSRGNFSSYPIFKVSKVKLVKWFLTRGFGLGVGCYLANFIHGGKLEKVEMVRQKGMREYFGESMKIDDLRDKMWSAGLRKGMSSVGDYIQSGAEKMWRAGLSEKMSSVQKYLKHYID